MEYKEIVNNLQAVKSTLRKAGFNPKELTLGEFAGAMSLLDEIINELDTARKNGTE